MQNDSEDEGHGSWAESLAAIVNCGISTAFADGTESGSRPPPVPPPAEEDDTSSMVDNLLRCGGSEAGQTYEAEVALSDYSGSSGVHVPLVLKANSGVYEDKWSLGMGLLMSNRNNYVVDQESREVETRNRFSMLLGLLKVDSMPEETKVRLLWFITLRAS